MSKKHSAQELQQAQDAVMLTTAVFTEILPCPAYDVYMAVELLRNAGVGPTAFAQFFKKVVIESGMSIADMGRTSLSAVAYHMFSSLLQLDPSWFVRFFAASFDETTLSVAEQHSRWESLSTELDAGSSVNPQVYKLLREELDKLKPEQSLIQIVSH